MRTLLVSLILIVSAHSSFAARFDRKTDRHAAFCAGLMATDLIVPKPLGRPAIQVQLETFLAATETGDGAPPLKEEDRRSLQELSDILTLGKIQSDEIRAWTITGAHAIEGYRLFLEATRARLRQDIVAYEKRAKFTNKVVAGFTDYAQTQSPYFYAITFGLEAVAFSMLPDFRAALIQLPVGIMALLGIFDAPWRYWASRQPGFMNLNKTIEKFLDQQPPLAYWGTHFQISDELIQHSFRSSKVSGKALSDQNRYETLPGGPRMIAAYRRQRDGHFRGQFEADALFSRSSTGEPSMTLIVQRTSVPR